MDDLTTTDVALSVVAATDTNDDVINTTGGFEETPILKESVIKSQKQAFEKPTEGVTTTTIKTTVETTNTPCVPITPKQKQNIKLKNELLTSLAPNDVKVKKVIVKNI